jgi:hypothetical protein
VGDPADRAIGPAGILVQAILDGVPGEGHFGKFLGGLVDLAGPQWPLGSREYSNHRLLNGAGPSPDLALRLGFRPWPGRERADQQVRASELVAGSRVLRFLPFVVSLTTPRVWHRRLLGHSALDFEPSADSRHVETASASVSVCAASREYA